MILASLLLAAALDACSADQSEGALEVRIKDHREAIGDFASLVLKLDEILISRQRGLFFWKENWQSLTPRREAIDLTRYVGTGSAEVFSGRVASGSYDAIHLKVGAIEGMLKNQRSVPVENRLGPIQLSFSVRDGAHSRIVLDLVVLDMSDHPPLGYQLGLKGYELYTNGKLVDKIPPG